MAVDLEQKIMSAIGFASHYQFFNGSRSCAGYAASAVNALSKRFRMPMIVQKRLLPRLKN